jgi:hypothetical protein
MGQAEEAEVAYRRLIESNPDKIGNYKAMLKARGLDLGKSVTSLPCKIASLNSNFVSNRW